VGVERRAGIAVSGGAVARRGRPGGALIGDHELLGVLLATRSDDEQLIDDRFGARLCSPRRICQRRRLSEGASLAVGPAAALL
jgi:hypothetical protein